MLDFIDPIPLSDHQWWCVQAAAKSALGEGAYPILDPWNQRDPKRYDEKRNELRFESIDIDDTREEPKITFATLMFMARQKGGKAAADLCYELRQKWFEDAWNNELASDADLADDVVEAVTRDWSSKEIAPDNGRKTWLEEMNQGFAHVIVGGKAKIMRVNEDGSRRDNIDIAAFKSLFRNQFVVVDGDKKNKAEVWLAHPSRREYDGVDFLPGSETPPGTFNLFTGFASTPDPNASCEKFLNHLRNVICEDDEAGFDYLIHWMAHLIQHPDEKPGVVIVMRGEQGVGKDTVGAYLSAVIGKQYAPTINQSKHLTGQFLGHLEQALLACVEEGSWAGSRRDDDILKSLITASTMTIERKGIDAYTVRSSARFMITTNSDWAVPAAPKERRYAVYDIKSSRREPEYYSGIYQELEHGGANGLHHLLLSIDLSNFDVRYAPKSIGLINQKVASLRDFQKFWFECLCAGEVPGRHPKQLFEVSTNWDEQEVVVTKASLRDAYAERHQRSVRSAEYRFSAISENQFRRHLLEVCPNARHARLSDDTNKQIRCFVIPNLGECRLAFESFLGGEIDWGDW